MDLREKVGNWLNNLKLFALNSEVHCSREEKALGKEFIGTRNVNMALNEMIKYMHFDMEFQYENIVSQPAIIPGGKQILLFSVGDKNLYLEISAIHEIMMYPIKNYRQFTIKNNPLMIGIINWHEGLVPLIETNKLLGITENIAKYVAILDIGKECFAFTMTNVYAKHEIQSTDYGIGIEVDNKKYDYLDLNKYVSELVRSRMNLEI